VPIDPTVIQRSQQAAGGFNSPFKNLATMIDMDAIRTRQRQQEVETAKAARLEEEAQAVRQILTEAGDLSDATLQRITQVAPTVGLKMRTDLIDQRSKLFDVTKKAREAEQADTEDGLALLGIARQRPELWPQVRTLAMQRGGDIAQLLEPHADFDPAVVDALMQKGLTVKEQLDADGKALEGLMKGDYRYLAGALARVKDDPEELQERLEAFRVAGVPRSVLQTLMTDPEGLSLTENERQMAADRVADNKRQAEAAAAAAEERAIDNKRADAQLGISQAQLGLSRQRLAQSQATAGQPKPLTATAESNIINRLSKEWTAASKTPRELDRAVSLMETGLAAARRGDLAAGSQAVLVTFQKILDPTSVVRESEYDRSAAGQSMYNRVAGAFERLSQGGAGVRLGELEKFAALAKEAAAAQKGAIGPIRERIGKVADRYGIPRELVIEGIAADPEAAAPGQPQQASPAPAAGGNPRYQRYLKSRGGRQ
jgi:hypothetical protein